MTDKKVVQDVSCLEQKGGVLMDCLMTICRVHHMNVSRANLISGLPLDKGNLTPAGFERAAKRAGLTSRTVRRTLEQINTALLPAVLILEDERACVVHAITDSNASVSYPELDSATVTVPFEEIDKSYTGYVIFARPEMHARANKSGIDKS